MFSKHVSSSGDPATKSETTNSTYLFTKFVVCIDSDQSVFVIHVEWQFTFQESLANLPNFARLCFGRLKVEPFLLKIFVKIQDLAAATREQNNQIKKTGFLLKIFVKIQDLAAATREQNNQIKKTGLFLLGSKIHTR